MLCDLGAAFLLLGWAGIAGRLRITNPAAGLFVGTLLAVIGLFLGTGRWTIVFDGKQRCLTERCTGIWPRGRTIPFSEILSLELRVRSVPLVSLRRPTRIYDVIVNPRDGAPLIAFESQILDPAKREAPELARIRGIHLVDNDSV